MNRPPLLMKPGFNPVSSSSVFIRWIERANNLKIVILVTLTFINRTYLTEYQHHSGVIAKVIRLYAMLCLPLIWLFPAELL